MDLPTEAEAMAILSAHEAALALEWERCEHWIASALEHDGGFHTVEDVRNEVFSGRAQFWPGERSVGVSRWWGDTQKGRVLSIWVAAGDMDELVNQMLPAGEAWARERGCSRVMLFGRPGWQRVLEKQGFKPGVVQLLKELDT